MHFLFKALLRYRRDGTGPVAASLSDDPVKREVELEFVTRATECLLKTLRPRESRSESS